jgi:hypothetical protein
MLDPAPFVDDVADPFIVIRVGVQIEQPESDPETKHDDNEPRTLWTHVRQSLSGHDQS